LAVKLVRTSLPTLPRREFRVAALDGAGELLADPGDRHSARRLVSHMVEGEGDGWLDQLPAAIFDRLCAAIFERDFSATVGCRSDCGKCGEPFDFAFDISDLIAAQDSAAAGLELALDQEGYWTVEGGLSLRPPTLGDLAGKLPPDTLAKLLVRSGRRDDPAIEVLLDEAAPLLTLPIATRCPHCQEAQEAAFDMAGYLVASIAADHAFLVRETHLLASRYGWTHESIMALPRSDRRAYAALIESERSAALARQSA
jgi:hypothetical protein